jgi:integrase
MAKKMQLPKYVFQARKAYWYKPWLGRVDGKQKWGKVVRLADDTVPMSELWAIYEGLGKAPRDTVKWMLDLYLESQQFARLAPKTRKDYTTAIEKMCSKPAGSITFGECLLSKVTKRTIRDYLDTYPHPVAANRHIAVLKSAWSWCEERHEIPENPCKSVKLNREEPRQRYVSDDEYETVLRMAPPPISQMMELSYLLRGRLSEVLAIKVEHIHDDYLEFHRLKGSEGELCELSERLRDALSVVRGGEHICHQYSESGFRSAWRRLQGNMKKAGIEPFPFHDLKARGVSDHVDNFAGHRSPNMKKVYVRKLQRVPATM